MYRITSIEALERRNLLSGNSADIDGDSVVTARDVLVVAQVLRGDIKTMRDGERGSTRLDDNAPALAIDDWTFALPFAKADVNSDGIINEKDLDDAVAQLLCNGHDLSQVPDINNDGILDAKDFSQLANEVALVDSASAAQVGKFQPERNVALEGKGVGGSNEQVELPTEISASNGEGQGEGLNGDSETGSPPQINVTIYRGQNGAMVPDASEVSVGSFTVANLNDTDGDSIVDNADSWVTASALGENEVDLMKLVVQQPSSFTGGDTYVQVMQGVAKICYNSNRGICQTGVTIHDWEWGFGAKTFWVEASIKSASVRDILVQASYSNLNGAATDQVKATGIWAEVSRVEDASKPASTAIAGFSALDPVVASAVNAYGRTGLVPKTNPSNFFLVTIIEFQVYPSGVQNEPDVHFDMTRRAEVVSWKLNGSTWTLAHGMTMPTKLDEANDDPAEVPLFDEADEPNQFDRISQMDSPGFGLGPWYLILGSDAYTQQGNFEEFVRVDVTGGDPDGNGLVASRASEKYDWHFRQKVHWLGVLSGYQRWPTPPTPTTETWFHRIDPGHVVIYNGDIPLP